MNERVLVIGMVGAAFLIAIGCLGMAAVRDHDGQALTALTLIATSVAAGLLAYLGLKSDDHGGS